MYKSPHSDAIPILRGWLAALEPRWDVPRAPETICRELGVELVVGMVESAESSSDRLTRRLREKVAQSKPKDGLFIPGGEPVIFVASSAKSTDLLTPRQRFTWAHEFAHYLVWKATGQSVLGDYWDCERACDWFASLFLMPDYVLKEKIGHPSRAWLGLVHELRSTCQVSWAAATSRMTAYSKGKVLFIAGEVVRPPDDYWQIQVKHSSANLYAGKPLGSRAVIREYVFLERCRVLADGELLVSKLSQDIGGLKTAGCWSVTRKWGTRVEVMIRTTPLTAAEFWLTS